jgi:palmitoyl-protein thioesterase
MHFSAFLLLFVLPALSSPVQNALVKPGKPETSLPVVFWHGLGDTYAGKGLGQISEKINTTYPGTFVHSIYIDEDVSRDRNAGFLGHVSSQVRPSWDSPINVD